MHIHAPAVLEQGAKVRIEVPFKLEDQSNTLFRLWYELPAQYRPHIDESRADFAVLALLTIAMVRRENIRVAGCLSPRLLFGLRDHQHIFASWFPPLDPIAITGDDICPVEKVGGGATGTFFSGGVDSFYTLWTHRADRESIPEYRISHAFYIDGFDSDLEQPEVYRSSLDSYRRLLRTVGVSLIPVRTNLKRFVPDGLWRPTFGRFLMSIAHLLPGLLARVYIPSSNTYGDFMKVPEGANPLTDHLCSSEHIQVIHDGATASRHEKVEAIADWPLTYDHLYVCFGRDNKDMMNCCRCEKCIRTMIALRLAGALDQYSTFPQPLTRRVIRRWRMPYYYISKYWARDMLQRAKREGHRALAWDLRWVVASHEVRNSRLGRWARRVFVEPAKRIALLRKAHAAWRHWRAA
jgi:hypothetical protein